MKTKKLDVSFSPPMMPRSGKDARGPLMATYEGRRIDGDAVVTVDGVLLAARNDLRNHSPGGFSWGYAGSGPSQLALGILAHHFHQAADSPELADAKALALYHDFKLKLITTLQGDWQFDTHVVADTVSMIVKEESERYFALAMRLEVENRRLTQELSECYTMLEPSHTDKE